jgi:lipoprotein-anchoring transpeptidase ErfK/SrfK
MRRAFVSVLLVSALYIPGLYGSAFAQASAPPAESGNFIERLFAGAAPEPAVERPFQPAPQYPAYPSNFPPSLPPKASSQAAPLQQVHNQAAVPKPGNHRPAAASQASRQAAAPDFDYEKIIPMPQLGYEPLPPVAPQPPAIQSASAEPAPGFAPSSQGDMAHPPVDPKYDRQLVDYKSSDASGTVVIDTPNHFLYLVQEHGKAMRYGIGVGRLGFTWAGVKTITAKKEWPDWYPPSDMLQRRPDLPRYMAGGPENPLGARAMYLGSTLYRIHGSNEPWTIGSNVSSGCIRLRNADVIDLFNRVQVGAKVVVM